MTEEAAPSGLLELLTAERTKLECEAVFQSVLDGKSANLRVNLDHLSGAVGLVDAAITRNYPDYQIPPHAFWRMLEREGGDRWDSLAATRGFSSAEDLLLVAGDLAILAGAAITFAPNGWIYADPLTGKEVGGVHGMTRALFDMFKAGLFSSNPFDPFRVDVDALIRLETKEIAAGFGLGPTIHADWVASMTSHLKRFGETVGMRPDIFGKAGDLRPGFLLARIGCEANGEAVSLGTIFNKVSDALAPLWKGGVQEGDLILGDCWQLNVDHEEKFVPFHVYVQKIAYSLIEPLAWAGVETAGYDELPGPSDALHAHLFFETGVIELFGMEFNSKAMVELRAVTCALTVRLAEQMRLKLETDEYALPLPCVLEGGTATVARKLAMEKPDSFQKVRNILSIGSVFWAPIGA